MPTLPNESEVIPNRMLLNKNTALIILLSFLAVPVLFGQDEENRQGTFFVSPDFGLMLGSVNRIEVSPAFGYHVTDRLSAAAGFKYEFYSQTRYYSYQPQYKTSIYGPRFFARYTFFRNLGDFFPVGMNTALFAHAEAESNSLERKYFDIPNFPEQGRFWYHAFLVGGGISQSASERIKLNFLILWDTGQGSVSLYSNPVIRFGLQFYFGRQDR